MNCTKSSILCKTNDNSYGPTVRARNNKPQEMTHWLQKTKERIDCPSQTSCRTDTHTLRGHTLTHTQKKRNTVVHISGQTLFALVLILCSEFQQTRAKTAEINVQLENIEPK